MAGRPTVSDPRIEKVNIRLTVSEKTELEAYAKAKGMTIAKVLLNALKAYMEKNEN